MEELARLTPGRSGADIEAICRRASLLALREWIAPKIQLGRVQITEEKPENETTANPGQDAHNEENPQETSQPGMPPLPNTRFEICLEQFTTAINEQRERYAVQEVAEEARTRQAEGRQRLLEMAANYNSGEKPPLRGFRLWLARLFGLVPRT